MPRTMRQTTVRFGADLWSQLVHASEREGVSVAQYVREAAVARLARGGAYAQARPPGGDGSATPEADPVRGDLQQLRREAESRHDGSRSAGA